MKKIMEKLKQMNNDFEALKKLHHKEGKEKYSQMSQFLERIIDRLYPEKDAKQLKSKLYPGAYIVTGQTDSEEQKEFRDDIDMKVNVIQTILEESELFGFEDFKPIKEKTETEWQVGSDKIGYLKKKTTR